MPQRGTSVLVVSHDLALIKRMKKRVLILDHGKLMDDISPAAMRLSLPAVIRPNPPGRVRVSGSGWTSISTVSSPAWAACCAGRGPRC